MEIFRLFGSILINNDEANNSLSRTNQSASNVASTLGKGVVAAGKWAVGIATAAGAVGTAAVKSATETEKSFAQTKTLLTGNEREMEQYYNKLMDLSNETGIAFEDLSSAMYEALSSGVDQNNVIDFVSSSVDLARGGFTDAATAIDVVTTALNAYGLSAEDATHIQDVLVMTQDKGKVSVGELASSMGKLIPSAKAANISVDQLGAAYATVTANGVRSAEATTYMNGMINELSKNGTKASTALQEAAQGTEAEGKSFQQLMDEGYTLTDVLTMMEEHAKDTGQSMIDLFGSSDAVKAAQILVDKSEEYTENLQSMENSTGAARKNSEMMMDTLDFKITKLKTNITNMATQLGSALLPSVTKFVDLIVDNLPVITDLFDMLLPIITDLFEDMLPILMDIIKGVLPSVMSLVTTLMPYFNKILNSIIPLAIKLLEKIVPPLIEIIDKLLPTLFEIFDRLSPILDVVFDLIIHLAKAFQNLVDPLLNVLNATLPIVDVFVDLINFIANNITAKDGQFNKLGSVIMDVLIWSLELLSDILIDVVLPAFEGAVAFLKGDFSTGFTKVAEAFTNAWLDAFGIIDDLFGTNIKGWMEEVQAFWFDAGGKLYQVLNADKLQENELSNKYTNLNSDMQKHIVEQLRSGATVEEAMQAAKSQFLDTSEKIYYFDSALSDMINESTVKEWRNNILSNKGLYAQGYSNAIETTMPTMGKATADYYKNQALKIPKLASGGLAYGQTLALVGDNANAAANPEVVAPLSDLAEINSKAFDKSLDRFLEKLKMNSGISNSHNFDIKVCLSDDTLLTRAIVKNINNLTRQDGVCVIKGV